MLAVGIGTVLALDPVPQSADYHQFADTHGYFGVPNFGDLVSIAESLLVGVIVLVTLIRQYAAAVATWVAFRML